MVEAFDRIHYSFDRFEAFAEGSINYDFRDLKLQLASQLYDQR